MLRELGETVEAREATPRAVEIPSTEVGSGRLRCGRSGVSNVKAPPAPAEGDTPLPPFGVQTHLRPMREATARGRGKETDSVSLCTPSPTSQYWPAGARGRGAPDLLAFAGKNRVGCHLPSLGSPDISHRPGQRYPRRSEMRGEWR